MTIESLFIQAFCIVVLVMLAGCVIEKRHQKEMPKKKAKKMVDMVGG